MRQLFHHLKVGLIAGGILCATFITLWYVLCFSCLAFGDYIPNGQKLLDAFFTSLIGRIVGIYIYGGIYLFLAASFPLGFVYSFCIYLWRRTKL